MEHDHAVSILESLHKDSKVFQGILAASDCYPIKDRKTALAKFLYGMGDALLDSPRQTDLFSDASKTEAPVGALVECPECHEKQTDGGPGSACLNCGVGPMPTNMQLSAAACHKALCAVLAEEDQIDIE